MTFFTTLFNFIKSFFSKQKTLTSFFTRKKTTVKTTETIGFMGEVEHFEGGYYTLPVIIEHEVGITFQPVDTTDKKDIQ